MSVTIAQFYTQVSDELRRGTSFDSLIPGKLRKALRWMEDQVTWRHMRHYATVSFDLACSNPRAISQPTGFKRMEFWRILKPDAGGYRYLTQVDPKDVDKTETAMPNAYWLDGVDYFWADNTPDQAYSTEMAYDSYTTLPADTAQAPYVLQAFEGVLLHATCFLFGATLRDMNFKNMHNEIVSDFLKAAVDADLESKHGNESLSVTYGWEFREQVNQGGTT